MLITLFCVDEPITGGGGGGGGGRGEYNWKFTVCRFSFAWLMFGKLGSCPISIKLPLA